MPSYTVTFAYFLVLTVGWLFVAERRQGTLTRLRAAPLSRTQLLVGKLLPCFTLSVAQGIFLLLAGKLIFNMSWGSAPFALLLVVFSTSLAAMGLALLVAAIARTETQVAIYGTLLVLVLATSAGTGLVGRLGGDDSDAATNPTWRIIAGLYFVVVVAGAGIIGTWHALELAEAGFEVDHLEA